MSPPPTLTQRLLPILLFLLLGLFPSAVRSFPAARRHEGGLSGGETACRNEAYHPLDYSAKIRRDPSLPVCPAEGTSGAADATGLLGRQVTQQTDFSCSETRPCINGACCPKETGWCSYGPDACGTTNTSPNDVCWSNCDAKAECGRHADPPGKECPLNACCSPWGFCGMTADFCKVTDDEETSCQSNCEQPGSTGSKSDVTKRVVGYYESSAHIRKCSGMSIQQIPAGALTHLIFSFGFITPNDFKIIPMDNMDPRLFSEITALKRRNRDLKVMIALGGRTFNDPGPWQSVFRDICSSEANRTTFITNLLAFMRQHAFDGVDFDWEYPGAEDRGGRPGDGENFTALLRALRAAIREQPVEYVVSFTAPASFWYLQHFDLAASSDAVDFVNVMSYDLHGVWDAWNPIGSHVLAHTNMTELKLALDLYWRNDIPAEKLNLGLGFYGRSFELADPACSKPGCSFRGGARPGPCTDNSGTLAYFEIQNIIEEKRLTPYYEKEAEVKYIVWDENQWISFDDEETIQAKIEWANSIGLGGLFIWSIDQDTRSLDALGAVVGRDTVARALKSSTADDVGYWQDIGSQGCYVSGCGGKCKAGFKKVTTQPCGSAMAASGHSTEADSTLCCPLSAAPDPKDCTWRGGPTACNGRCHDDEVILNRNRWGDGSYCESGSKAYCCKAAQQERANHCYWGGKGQQCESGDKVLTFKGAWQDDDDGDIAGLADLVGDRLKGALDDHRVWERQYYCCPPDDFDRWKNGNCRWKGTGNCDDNVCDVGKQVQLDHSVNGEGRRCRPAAGRARVFCCDPPDGERLSLPVPLEDLIPDAPSGADVKTEFDLHIDNTWGDGDTDNDGEDDPNESAFQFFVLASDSKIQVTLDKRDGSHWEVFNCNDRVGEEEQTVQMVCTDTSEGSTCGDIFLGQGAPGTIIEMPRGQGCGPGKYAVVKALEVSSNQTLPGHLAKRSFAAENPVVHDLTFDYDFLRVPRDEHPTMMRIDFSNQEGYWDHVVARPSEKKAKRSLAELGGNHRRWLEEEWKDDYHHGAVSPAELHKRWFGQDVLAWLRNLLKINIKKEKRYDYAEDISAIILREDWTCDNPNFYFRAKIDAVCAASIKMSTSFGFTLITTLGPGMDLSNSFLYFASEGNIEAIFTLDALASVDWDSGVFSLGDLPLPGISFNIPGIVNIGPGLRLDARFKADIAAEGRVEARVTLADWDVRQTYPQKNSHYAPQIKHAPNRGLDINGLSEPTFDYSLQANGYAEAHIIPTISFGIVFNERFGIGGAAVELAGDGWTRMRVRSDPDSETCSFGYAVDAGASLQVRGRVPDAFNWQPAPLTIGEIEKTLIPRNGDEFRCVPGRSAARSIDPPAWDWDFAPAANESRAAVGLEKRLISYGPMISIPVSKLLCPNKGGTTASVDCLNQQTLPGFWDEAGTDFPAKRDIGESQDGFEHVVEDEDVEKSLNRTFPSLQRLPQNESLAICSGSRIDFQAWDEHGSYQIFDNADWSDCNNYDFGTQADRQTVPKARGPQKYVVDHILEAHLIAAFVKETGTCKNLSVNGWENTDYYYDFPGHAGIRTTPWDYVASAFPHEGFADSEFVRILEELSVAKENAYKLENVSGEKNMDDHLQSEDKLDNAIRWMKTVLMVYKYNMTPAIVEIMVAQSNRVAKHLQTAEETIARAHPSHQQFDLGDWWRAFIRTRFEETMTYLDYRLGHYTSRIEAVLSSTDPAGDVSVRGRAVRREKIRKLRAAVDGRERWTNPFP